MNDILFNFLSSEEITNIMNDPNVTLHKHRLSETPMVHFSIPLYETIKTKLEKRIKVSQMIPMTWVRGDTVEHVDKGISPFETTFLIYLTDSDGEFIVDGQHYSISAGNAHIFSEGLSHSTVDTKKDRLIMGPMSETGLAVGGPPSIIYYPLDGDLEPNCNITYYSYSSKAYILNIPPPIPVSTNNYNVQYTNNTGYDDKTIWSPPSGKKFGGWKIKNGFSPIGNNTSDKIYIPGEIYTYTNYTVLVPNWINVPRALPSFKLHFTDNTMVFYKSNSLSTGSGGVRNYRHKQRKT